MEASGRVSEEGFSSILEAGADVNAFDKDRRTALHMAILKSNPNRIQLLLDKGSSVNATDISGYSALRLASEGNSYNVVFLLIEAGADVNQSNGGTTALHCTAKAGFHSIMKLLLEAGADVNASNPRKCTVLMTAARSHHDKCVKLLLDSGADVNSIDTNNRTALMHACSENDHDPRGPACLMNTLQELLLRGGAVNKKISNKALPMLLQAAGETVNHRFVREYDDWGRVMESIDVQEFMAAPSDDETPPSSLKHLSREAIRNHLRHLDPHAHLFARVHHLQLPLYLPEYLVYNMSLDKEYVFDDNNDDDDNDSFDSRFSITSCSSEEEY